MRKINKIIIHCTATSKGKHYDVDEIRRWHVDGRGWSDIGYHWLIYLDGSIIEGRPEKRIGAHTKGQNKNSIGISYVGGVSNIKNKSKKFPAEDTRTPEQIISLDCLLKDLLIKYPNSKIQGHNEYSNKACPSFDVQKEYKYLSNL